MEEEQTWRMPEGELAQKKEETRRQKEKEAAEARRKKEEEETQKKAQESEMNRTMYEEAEKKLQEEEGEFENESLRTIEREATIVTLQVNVVLLSAVLCYSLFMFVVTLFISCSIYINYEAPHCE